MAMIQTETAMKQTKYIKFSYRSPTSKKRVKEENVDDELNTREIPRIITTDDGEYSPTPRGVKRERESDGAEDEAKSKSALRGSEQYVTIDEDYYSNLDKIQYPFSSKYIPMKHATTTQNDHDRESSGSQSPTVINNPSVLLHQLENYKTVSVENELQWGEVSNQVVDSLRDWRRLYKILDYKKRQLKKAQNNKNSSSTGFNSNNNKSNTNGSSNPSNDSSNGNDESEDQVSSDNSNHNNTATSSSGVVVNGRGGRDGVKRRKLSKGQEHEDEEGTGYSSSTNEQRKTRSTRSSR